jgi:hypothetical protein
MTTPASSEPGRHTTGSGLALAAICEASSTASETKASETKTSPPQARAAEALGDFI